MMEIYEELIKELKRAVGETASYEQDTQPPVIVISTEPPRGQIVNLDLRWWE